MIKIDKSAFTPEELATYQALIAKATVNADDETYAEDEGDFELPTKRKKPFTKEEQPMEKSAASLSSPQHLNASRPSKSRSR